MKNIIKTVAMRQTYISVIQWEANFSFYKDLSKQFKQYPKDTMSLQIENKQMQNIIFLTEIPMEPHPIQILINEVFSSETDEKRRQMANKLIQQEYNTIEDLKELDTEGWKFFIQHNILTIKKVEKLRKHLKDKTQKSQSPNQKIITYSQTPTQKKPQSKNKNSYYIQLTRQEKEILCVLLKNNSYKPEQIVKLMGSEVNSPKGELILTEIKLLIRPLKPEPTQYKRTSLKRKQGVLPVYLYTGKQLVGVKYYTFLVIGGTGTGKTTLLDAFVNRIMGIQYTDNWRYKLVDQSHIQSKSQTQSQTSELKIYYINDPANKFNIKMIDTPGFGDTKGNQVDIQTRNKFQEFFKINDQIDYILFTTKASDVRLSKDAVYIYSEIQKLFSKDVSDRFLLMCTHSQKGVEPNCLQAIRKTNFIYEKYFCFSNGALFNSKRVSQSDWNLGMESIDKFIQFILQQERLPISLSQSSQVLQLRRHLQTSIQTSQQSFKDSTYQLKQTKATLQSLRKSKKSIIDNGQWKHINRVLEPTVIKKLNDCYQLCQNCRVTCCQVCKWPSDQPLSQCTYFSGGNNCPKCPGKCSIYSHARIYEQIQMVWVQKVEIKTNMKSDYQQGISNAEVFKRKVEQMICRLEQDIKNIWKYAQEIKVNLKLLNENALKPRNYQEQEYYIQLIVQEKQTRDDGWGDRVNYYQEVIHQLKMCKKFENAESIQDLFPDVKAIKQDCRKQWEQTMTFTDKVKKK